MKKFSWIDVLIIILFLLSVYLILTRIFGHSATDLAIGIALSSALGSLLYKLNREFGEFKIKTINSFKNIKKDIAQIKGNAEEIINGISEIKRKVK